MTTTPIIEWLMQGDVAIQFQTQRDLLDATNILDLQKKIAHEGCGLAFLSKRTPHGHWGNGFYHPKWTCTHYSLLDLKNLGVDSRIPVIRETVNDLLLRSKGSDGGINPSGTLKASDVCINGMALNYCSYFRANNQYLESIVNFLLAEHMPDGGFNCQSNRKGANHSSMHSTICVLEGVREYIHGGYQYRINELKAAEKRSIEFLLIHKLFRSDRTDQVINKKCLDLSFPSRWYYDILRALDYLQAANVPYDPRMEEALTLLQNKQTKDGKWKLGPKHVGETHFEMESRGQLSRWNTLRALRVLRAYRNPG